MLLEVEVEQVLLEVTLFFHQQVLELEMEEQEE
jgi:hypothetical protein